MTLYVVALLLGVVAGLRAMTAPAAAAWGAALGRFHVEGTWMSFLAIRWVPWIFTALAVAELVSDQLPNTPSRKVPVQFGTRLLAGGLAGAAACAPGAWIVGAVLGVVGAVIGTLGGAEGRARLAKSFGKDLPAALIEDAVAVVGAAVLVFLVR